MSNLSNRILSLLRIILNANILIKLEVGRWMLEVFD